MQRLNDNEKQKEEKEKEKEKCREYFMIAGQWRTKAFMYAQALVDPDKKEALEKSDQTTERCVTVPDHPFSLIENQGLAGKICFMSDLFR